VVRHVAGEIVSDEQHELARVCTKPSKLHPYVQTYLNDASISFNE
jgi:hypothetical protein